MDDKYVLMFSVGYLDYLYFFSNMSSTLVSFLGDQPFTCLYVFFLCLLLLVTQEKILAVSFSFEV